MKIHFSNVSFKSTTGPNTFASRLANEFKNLGHDVVDETDKYDIFLAFIEPATAPRRDCKVVQRLDGIWSKPQEINIKNNSIKDCYLKADAVIFQSQFDKKFIVSQWGEPNTNSIINNGIEINKITNIDYGIQRLKNENGVVFITSANWHRQKRLYENTMLFKHLQKTYESSCLVVLGNNPDYVIADPKIYYAGNLPHEVCLQLYSISDWMLHLAYADHMPNVVVEALSQNCPIICSETGGTKEIVGNNGIVLSESKLFDNKPFDYDNPPIIDVTQISELPEIIVDNKHIDIKFIAGNYIELFTKVINS